MALKLICGPTGSGKTSRVIEAFIAALDRGEKAVFIAPSGPDARHFQREIIRALGKDEATPGVLTGGRVTTFGGLCRELLNGAEPGARIINESERFLLLRAIVDATSELTSLSRSSGFDGFVTALGNIISELESLGVDSTLMGKRLRSWAKGNKWRQELNKDIFRLYGKYESVLQDQGIYDEDLVQRQALEILSSDASLLEHETVIVDGFWDFTPLQHDLLEKLSSSAETVLVTVPFQKGRVAYDASAPHRERLSTVAGSNIKMLDARLDTTREAELNHLLDNLFEEAPPRVPAAGAVFRLTAAGSRGEAETVAAEILKLWRAGQDLDKVAIVYRNPGPDMYTMAAALEDFGVPFELPAPVPLVETVVGRTALAALDFAAGSRSRASLFSYLRSRLSGIPPQQVDSFDRHARLNVIEAPADLLMEWKTTNGRPLDELDRLAAAVNQGMTALGGELCATIRGLLSSGRYIDRSTAATLSRDIAALESLASLCGDAGLVREILGETVHGGKRKDTRAAANAQRAAANAQLLSRAIKAATIRLPATTHRRCVRLLDPHRILNQRFEIVFVCGLLEKQFPSLGYEDSFFSDSDRAEIASRHEIPLEDHQGRLDEERFLYFRTLSRASRRVYLCYPSSDKEGKPAIPSLFVSDTTDLYEEGSIRSWDRKISDIVFPPGQAPTAGQAVRSLALQNAGEGERQRRLLLDAARPAGLDRRLENCLDSASPGAPLISDPRVIESLKKQASFRVTDLQGYLRCPFRYFVERQLVPCEMEPEAHGLHRGRVIHDILCRFSSQLSRSRVYLSDADEVQIREARRLMKRIIEEEFAGAGSDLETMILKTELEYHLDRFIDRERASGRPLQYYDFELGFGSPARDCGGKNSEEEPLHMDGFDLRGRLDRVDWQENRQYALVIDYKASKSVASQARFETEKEIQIPLYMLALSRVFGLTPVGGEYYSIRGDARGGLYLEGHEQLFGFGSGQVNEKDIVEPQTFHERLQHAIVLAEDAVAGIRAGSFPCESLKGNDDCRWCGFGGICRRKALPDDTGVNSHE